MGVVLTTAFAFAFFIAADVAQGGLGTSNGRAVSFLNSLNSVASFRRQRRVLRSVSSDTTQQASPNTERKRSEVLYLRSSRHSAAHRVKLFSLVFLAKFGSQSLGSLMIGATPVVLKGPRHMASWLFSFACIQLCPRDSVYNKLQDHVALLLVVRIGCALYKLRKFTFVAEFALDRHLSFLWMLSALVVVIDGNNLCSRITTWGWLRGVGRTSTSDFLFGVVALLRRVIPIGLAASLVTCSTCAASPARHHHRWSVFFFFFPWVGRDAAAAASTGLSSVHDVDDASTAASTAEGVAAAAATEAASLGTAHPTTIGVFVKLIVFAVFLVRYDVHTLAVKTFRAAARNVHRRSSDGSTSWVFFPARPPPSVGTRRFVLKTTSTPRRRDVSHHPPFRSCASEDIRSSSPLARSASWQHLAGGGLFASAAGDAAAGLARQHAKAD